MDGRLVIDGYLIPEGTEINIHGGEPDPKALISITMRIHRNMAARKILEHVQDYIDACIGHEPEELFAVRGGKKD